MKKKSLKIIGKVSCIGLLFSVLLTAFVIPSFAWQNTNHGMAQQWFRGINSYSLAPLNSLYYEYYTASDNSTTNYSINAPNTLTSEGKANWGGAGQPLTQMYSERFGNNSRGTVYTRSWDSFVGGSLYVPLSDLPRENIITVENNSNVSVYPAFTSDDVWNAMIPTPATNVDAISYVVTRATDTNDDVRLICYFDPFISTQRFSRNLITYQMSSTDIQTTPLQIKYSFTFADLDGDLHNVNGDFLLSAYNNVGTTTIGGATYETCSVSILETILTYEEEEIGREGLDRESNQLIEWNSVYVAPNYYGGNTIVQCAVTSPHIRPYDQSLIDGVANGNDTYRNGYYSSIAPYQRVIWNSLFERDPVIDDDLPALELGPLGDSIGGAVTGVLDAEIFPNVSLWTLLLIPFSLGLVFTFIKFFAGG